MDLRQAAEKPRLYKEAEKVSKLFNCFDSNRRICYKVLLSNECAKSQQKS